MTANLLLFTEPKKSKWILCVGPAGQGKLNIIDLGEFSLLIKQATQLFVIPLIYLSILGHQMKDLVTLFILTTPI